jgi:hypothetical protein
VNDTPHSNDIDPGETVAELAQLELTPTTGFFARLRNRIERKMLGVECVDATKNGLVGMFCEFWHMIMSLFACAESDERGDRS